MGFRINRLISFKWEVWPKGVIKTARLQSRVGESIGHMGLNDGGVKLELKGIIGSTSAAKPEIHTCLGELS